MPRPGNAPTGRKSTEQQLLLGQAHDDGAVGVVETEVGKLEHGAAELEGAALFEGLVGQWGIGVLDDLETLLGALVGDDPRPGILERLAAGDVVEVVVAVDQIADRLVADLPDLLDVGGRGLRPAVGDRVGGDDAVVRDHEHRLVVAVAKHVDVVGAFDLGGLVHRALLLGVDGEGGKRPENEQKGLPHADLL